MAFLGLLVARCGGCYGGTGAGGVGIGGGAGFGHGTSSGGRAGGFGMEFIVGLPSAGTASMVLRGLVPQGDASRARALLPQALLAPEARWCRQRPGTRLSTVGAGDNRGGGKS